MTRKVLNGLNVGGGAQIVGSTDTVQLVVQDNGTQTVNLQEWRNSGGSPMAFMDQYGRFYQGNPICFSFDALNKKITIDASGGSAGADRLDIWLAPSETRRALRVLSSGGSELFTVGPDGRLAFGDPDSDVSIRKGAGTPEAAVTAPVGSLFLRTNGGGSTTLYVKESGAGNTGWAPTAPAAATSFASAVKWGTD